MYTLVPVNYDILKTKILKIMLLCKWSPTFCNWLTELGLTSFSTKTDHIDVLARLSCINPPIHDNPTTQTDQHIIGEGNSKSVYNESNTGTQHWNISIRCKLHLPGLLTSVISLRAVSAPRLKSEPGTLLLMVEGMTVMGIQNSLWLARCSASCSAAW